MANFKEILNKKFETSMVVESTHFFSSIKGKILESASDGKNSYSHSFHSSYLKLVLKLEEMFTIEGLSVVVKQSDPNNYVLTISW